ncbi:MAG: KamA family radical SAM protein [Deltaproteobacteria bacterium]
MKVIAKSNNKTWESILSRSITTPLDLPEFLDIEMKEDLERVAQKYPMRINPYTLRLIRRNNDFFYRQAVPDPRELADPRGFDDPLNEEALSPVPGLTHHYPDRVLFLVSSKCAMYCRFCNRKRKVGRASTVTKETLREGIAYIRKSRKVRDVLLSGGDPLLLSDKDLYGILSELRSMSHVEIIRIGTRVPCTLPQRVTPELAHLLGGFHPLYVNTHFNHPDEITPEAALACARLADAGIPLGCQTVLLKGVNDDDKIIRKLMQKLLTIRVKPYYLFQADQARGTAHFWTPLRKGMDIISKLQGHTTGLCVPHFAVDLPGGGGKVNLTRTAIRERHGRTLIKNYRGEDYECEECQKQAE